MIFLISDIHLDSRRPEVANGFLSYLDLLPKETEALYILGDCFEAWIGDDDLNPFFHQIIEALRKLSNRSIQVFVMHGNRDFLLGEVFAHQAQCQLISDPYLLVHQQHRYLLMHGDSLCTHDTSYIELRQQLRSPQWQADFLSKTLAERNTIAQNLRATSKAASSNKAEDIMDVTSAEVTRMLRENDVTTLIHGHTHRPACHELQIDGKQASRLVLGDWLKDGWHIRLDNNGPSLQHFPITELLNTVQEQHNNKSGEKDRQ